jgi:hypothetical protein
MDNPTFVLRQAARPPLFLACALFLGLDWSAAAQNTIVFNPEFDINVEDWGTGTLQTSDWDPDDANACPQSGSLSMTSTLGKGSAVAAFAPECLTVIEGDEVVLEVTYQSPNPMTLYLLQYTTANCTGDWTESSGAIIFPASAAWSTGEGGLFMSTPTDFQSVRFIAASVDPDPNNPFTARIDRAYLGRRTRLFADDFDGGSTCRWSSASP